MWSNDYLYFRKFDEPYNVNVAVGSNYLDTPYALYKATIFIVHAGYNKLLNLNDIGLIYISETILFNEKVQPITLPVVDRNYDNYPLIFTGWGKLWVKKIKYIFVKSKQYLCMLRRI